MSFCVFKKLYQLYIFNMFKLLKYSFLLLVLFFHFSLLAQIQAFFNDLYSVKTTKNEKTNEENQHQEQADFETNNLLEKTSEYYKKQGQSDAMYATCVFSMRNILSKELDLGTRLKAGFFPNNSVFSLPEDTDQKTRNQYELLSKECKTKGETYRKDRSKYRDSLFKYIEALKKYKKWKQNENKITNEHINYVEFLKRRSINIPVDLSRSFWDKEYKTEMNFFKKFNESRYKRYTKQTKRPIIFAPDTIRF